MFLWQANGHVKRRYCYTEVAQRKKLLHQVSHFIWLHVGNVIETEKNTFSFGLVINVMEEIASEGINKTRKFSTVRNDLPEKHFVKTFVNNNHLSLT